MNSPKIILITIVAAVVSIAAGVLGHRYLNPNHQPGMHADLIPGALASRDSLPDFTFPDLKGKPRKSNEWGGKVMVLNFWASWCPPCREEIPAFVGLQQEFASKGLQFVGIAIDDPAEVAKFSAEQNINYPVLLGDTDAIELSKRLGNRFQGLPFSVIFNRQGQVVHVQAGELKPEAIREHALPLL